MKSEIIKDLKHNIDYFDYHNKNLTKEQEEKINNIKEIIDKIDNINDYFEVCKDEVISAIEDIYNDELYFEYQDKIEKIDNDTINTIAWKLEDYDIWGDIYEYAREEILEKVVE